MVIVVKPIKRGIRAPQTASGTVTRITRGSRKLSNCAASTRKITMSAKPKETVKRLPSVTYWRLSDSQSTVVPTGRGWLFRKYTARSAEHTSELQSLMRNSYAVYCLKKKQY